MTFAQLTELGENIGVVSKGATRSAIDNLKTCCYRDAARTRARHFSTQHSVPRFWSRAGQDAVGCVSTPSLN